MLFVLDTAGKHFDEFSQTLLDVNILTNWKDFLGAGGNRTNYLLIVNLSVPIYVDILDHFVHLLLRELHSHVNHEMAELLSRDIADLVICLC